MVKSDVCWLGLGTDGMWGICLSLNYANQTFMQDEIAKDMHGAMFAPVFAESNKTTVSVVTGHQEYHPVYMSPGNLTNIAWWSHGNALLPFAFIPIPKSDYIQFLFGWLFSLTFPGSFQKAQENGQVSDLLLENVPCLPRSCLPSFKRWNDHSWNCLVSWWTLSTCNIWSWALHHWLPRTSVACSYC